MSFLCAPGWFRVVIEGKIHPLPRLKDLPLRTMSRRLLSLAWSRCVAQVSRALIPMDDALFVVRCVKGVARLPERRQAVIGPFHGISVLAHKE
jgi:hypothetical protein